MTNRNSRIAALYRQMLAVACGLALAACGGGGGGGGGTDLTGRWDFVEILTNGSPGWFVGTIDVAADGKISFVSALDHTGSTALPPTSLDQRLALDASGNVTLGGTNGSPSFHGTLASSKKLFTATESATASFQLVVARKRVAGVAFGAADVASFPFALHTLQAGNSPGWQVGAGTTNASGQITVASMLDSTGASCTTGTGNCPPASFDTIQVDANGFVTTANDATFHGIMTPDKNAIFGVSTTDTAAPQTFQVLAILRTGQAFAAADFPGTYGVHVLTSGATLAASNWFRGTVAIDTADLGTFTSALTSSGSTTLPAPVQFTFDAATGIIGRTTDALFHGRMALGKDFYVRTTGPASSPSMGIVVR